MDGFVQDATYFAMDNSTLTHIKGESRARLRHDLIPLAQSCGFMVQDCLPWLMNDEAVCVLTLSALGLLAFLRPSRETESMAMCSLRRRLRVCSGVDI